MNSGFALRVAVLGGLALALFAVIFFRLWYLQVLSGDQYLAEANNNRTREVRVGPPRGEILDRDGKVLVGNRTSLALQLDPGDLPADEKERRAELARLADLSGQTLDRVRKTMQRRAEPRPQLPGDAEAGRPERARLLPAENQAEFPGAEVRAVFVRRYPQGTLAAHLFGYIGEISEEELKQTRYRGLEAGDVIGKDGVEYEYDRYLRGRPGATRIQVDSLGRPKGELSVVDPVPGDNLRLSRSTPSVQAAGEGALVGDRPARRLRRDGRPRRRDPRRWARARPSTRPIFTKPAHPGRGTTPSSPRTPARRSSTARSPASIRPARPSSRSPRWRRSRSGAITPTETITDDGVFTLGGINFQNAGGAAYGTISMQYALQVSSDVFYLHARRPHVSGPRPAALGAAARASARRPASTCPLDSKGLLPTPRWRNELFAKGLTDRPWSAGDNVNLAVGQGDLQASPLQMAVAYATIGNGGTVVRAPRRLPDRGRRGPGRAGDRSAAGAQGRSSIRPTAR